MLTATASAMTGSSHTQPVAATANTATTTPTDVHTSVIRWWPSASSAIELWRRAAASRSRATAKFTAVATTETASPSPTCSIARGWSSRSTAVHAMATAAMRISAPSKALAKYSAFEYP